MSEVTKLTQEFFASCPEGLEELLYEEIKNLGVKELTLTRQGVLFNAYNEIALKVILYSRFSSRVFRRLYEFDIKKEKDLYIESRKIKWKAIFSNTQTFKISTNLGKSPNGLRRSNFKNSLFLSKLLKDSICDYFRGENLDRPNVELTRADIHLSMFIAPYDNTYSSKEKVTIMIDMVGDSLSNRGYRERAVVAPIRENLAAALVTLADLKKGEPLFDLMTGSGTIIIEAAMILGNIPPSFMKVKAYFKNKIPWSFLNHYWFTKDKYLQENFEKLLKNVSEETKKGIASLPRDTLYASDISRHVLDNARFHLEKTGLSEVVNLKVQDITKSQKIKETGVILINPPYGERLGEKEEAEILYHEIGETLKNSYKGFRAYIFTGDKNLLKKISLKPSNKITLHNGNLEGRFVKYELY